MTGDARRDGAPAYMPQLDALRAGAALLVLLNHYLPPDHVINRVPIGYLGVRLFFVLSGYLITTVLLDCKAAAERGSASRLAIARVFYIRRALRIVPIYYVCLGLFVAADVPTARSALAWHATYLSNIYYAKLGVFSGFTNHFWTLGVEEQFYLVWPALVLLTPQRHLLKAMVVVALVAPVCRGIAFASGATEITVDLLPLSCVDCLGLGGVLSVSRHGSEAYARFGRALCRLGVLVGLPALVTILAVEGATSHTLVSAVFRQLAAALVFVWLVDRASRGVRGLAGRMLEARPLVYLGRISYGVYLFHPLMQVLEARVYAAGGVPAIGLWPSVAIKIALVIALASASWHLFEAPIQRLKVRFPYPAPPRY